MSEVGEEGEGAQRWTSADGDPGRARLASRVTWRNLRSFSASREERKIERGPAGGSRRRAWKKRKRRRTSSVCGSEVLPGFSEAEEDEEKLGASRPRHPPERCPRLAPLDVERIHAVDPPQTAVSPSVLCTLCTDLNRRERVPFPALREPKFQLLPPLLELSDERQDPLLVYGIPPKPFLPPACPLLPSAGRERGRRQGGRRKTSKRGRRAPSKRPLVQSTSACQL